MMNIQTKFKILLFLFCYTYTVIGDRLGIIGIIGRPVVTDEGNDGVLVYKNICDALFNYGVFPICLIPNISGIDYNKSLNSREYKQLRQMIDICDGIVLQGGVNYSGYDKIITKYLYDKDIPTLGICLGMQTMGDTFNGSVLKDANHMISKDYVHYVKINKDSKLYQIIGKEYIFVNSMHQNRVYNTDLSITASCGEVAEALEDKNKKFFIGVQWHPECLKDENSDKLFLAFIKATLQNHCK